jgi:ribosomal protein S27E
MTGPTYAHMTVVIARSYSRISGQTCDDVVTNTSGGRADTQAAPTSDSWLSLA